jgi:hypothetical protein
MLLLCWGLTQALEEPTVATNPYAPPAANVDDLTDGDSAPPIWNPNPAANWSLIFSPAFGAFLQMRNWQELDEPERAATAKGWLVASVVMLVVYLCLAVSLSNPKSADAVTRMVGFAYLLIWYFAAGRSQSNYVKERFGKDYPRKGWGKPIGIAFAAMIGYVVLAGIAGFILAVARPA